MNITKKSWRNNQDG